MKKEYIIFDTNIWRHEFGLNSAAGSAVRFYINNRDATVIVPEVVRLELEEILTKHLQECRDTILNSHGQLLKVFGELKEVVLPTDEEICNKVSEIIENLDVPFVEIPFSLDAAKSSLLKTIKKERPSSKEREEFKDGVIWAHCLELLKEADVFLVSNDTDFYRDRKYEKGLASNLYNETKPFANKLKLVKDLGGLLEDIRQEVEIDQSKFLGAISEKSGEEIRRILEENEFSLGIGHIVEKKLFLTENAKILYIEFSISYECLDETKQERSNAALILKGSGAYEMDNQEFEKMSHSEILLQYTDIGGQQHHKRAYYASAQSIVLGHRTVKHTIKSPLSDSSAASQNEN